MNYKLNAIDTDKCVAGFISRAESNSQKNS